MKLKNEFIVLLLAFLLFNVSIFNYFFNIFHFPAWKQVLATIMLCFSLPNTIFNKCVHFRVMSYVIVLLFFLSLFHDDLNLLMVGYRYSGYGVFLFLIYLLSKESTSFIKVNKYMFILSFFIAIGVIIDFNFSGLDYFKSVNESAHELALDGNSYSRRVSLFLGSSSLLFMVLSFSFVIRCVIKNRLDKIDYIYMIISIFSIYVSGSRLSLIMLIILYALMYLSFSRSLIIKLTKSSILLLISFFALAFIFYFANDNPFLERIVGVFSEDDRGNVGRLMLYQWFFSNFLNFEISEILIGHGLGFLNTSENTLPSNHFESSFISVYIESGIVGLGLFFVLLYTIFSISQNNLYRIVIVLIVINLLIVPSWLNYTVMFIISYLFCFFYKYQRGLNVK